MSKYCPVLQSDVTYLVCQDCDDKECKQEGKTETDDIPNN